MEANQKMSVAELKQFLKVTNSRKLNLDTELKNHFCQETKADVPLSKEEEHKIKLEKLKELYNACRKYR